MKPAALVLLTVFTPADIAGAAAKLHATQAAQVALYEIDLFDARPERAADAFAVLSHYAASLRTSPGCHRVDLVRQSPPGGNHFATVVEWRDVKDRDRETSSAAAVSFRASFQPLAASPIDERLYTRTGP